MTSDVKINLFAHRISYLMWGIFEDVPGNVLLRKCLNEYRTERNCNNFFYPYFFYGIETVTRFYYCIFQTSINNDKIENLKSKKELCDYIRRKCNCENWFGIQSIFERVFTSIGFVLVCTGFGKSKDMRRYTPVCWEEYFNEYIEEFYNNGGWEELGRLAISYKPVGKFLCIINEKWSIKLLTKISKSVENYTYFIASLNIKIVSNVFKSLKIECGHESESKTFASLWIKFIVQKGNTQSFDNACTQPPKNPAEVAYLLKVLRHLCDPIQLEFRMYSSHLADVMSKSNERIICSPEPIQQYCTRKKNKKKGNSQYSNKKLTPSAAPGKSCSSLINNSSLGTTAEEKEHEDNDNNILSFTRLENDTTGKTSSNRITGANAPGVKPSSIEIKDNKWSIQKKDETNIEYIDRLVKYIRGSNESTNTKESHGKCKIKLKKNNSGKLEQKKKN